MESWGSGAVGSPGHLHSLRVDLFHGQGRNSFQVGLEVEAGSGATGSRRASSASIPTAALGLLSLGFPK